MNKLTFKDIDVSEKKVLVRVDFNVPINEEGIILFQTKVVPRIMNSHSSLFYLE